jgi:hypothetical protein
MGYESLLAHYSDNEFEWNFRMLMLGIGNAVGYGVMIAYL